MQNRWQTAEAERLQSDTGHGPDLADCIYVSRLLGQDTDLVMHGGGNTSVKSKSKNVFGEQQEILFVKASGFDLAGITASGFAALDLDRMRKFEAVQNLSQHEMLRQMRLCMLDPEDPTPSVEAFLHAFIPSKYVVHTHPAALLALTNQQEAERVVEQAFGQTVFPVPYIRAGFGLAKEAGRLFQNRPETAEGMVLMQHGLMTWGDTAEEAYAATIRLVTRAEDYWSSRIPTTVTVAPLPDTGQAAERYIKVAPLIRGLLAEKIQNGNQPFQRFILTPWIHPDALRFLQHPDAKKLSVSAPLTPDHLIRTKAVPLFIEDPAYDDPSRFYEQVRSAVGEYTREYDSYFERHTHRLHRDAVRVDSMPRVLLLPGIGAVCAGVDEKAAVVCRDITAQSITAKKLIAASGATYEGIAEEHLFEMEYLLMQQAKVQKEELRLQRQVAIVTGAAGAIGLGITEALLQHGCHVAVSDLPGPMLDQTSSRLEAAYKHQVLKVEMDVTESSSVQRGFEEVIRRWGGVDLVVVNAGVAMVSPLLEMDLDRFRHLEKVNVEGTLLVLREAARIFQMQKTGGDVVLISTKNVFAPGAKFGAYSATKAAAHQLARIASLEFAEMGVRVNMVAPDAVFSHGQTKSGLWAEVGPDRMKARGLDETGLEEYYRNRNLLKTTVTAEHVARAVLFFATRQTPTTGATLPVDGGLPDATPR